MSDTVRFWGTVTAVRPRLTLTKFGGETTAKCAGTIAVIEGQWTPENGKPEARRFTVALGAATQVRRAVAVGDLLRGEAHPVPEEAHDTPADLYRVGVLRTIARTGDPGAVPIPTPDPPRTDPPLTVEQAETAPRRALNPAHLVDGGPCADCGYGTIVCVVRLNDPRHYRNGLWRRVPACLGPEDCPHYSAPPAS
jgi:hypothetical protein